MTVQATATQFERNTTSGAKIKEVRGIRPNFRYVRLSSILCNLAQNLARTQASVEANAATLMRSLYLEGVHTPLTMLALRRDPENSAKDAPVDFHVRAGFTRYTALTQIKYNLKNGYELDFDTNEQEACGWDESIQDFWVPVAQTTTESLLEDFTHQLASNSGATMDIGDHVRASCLLLNQINPDTGKNYTSEQVAQVYFNANHLQSMNLKSASSRIRQWKVIGQLPFLDSLLGNVAVPTVEGTLSQIAKPLGKIQKHAAETGEDLTGEYMQLIVNTCENIYRKNAADTKDGEAPKMITGGQIKVAVNAFLTAKGIIEEQKHSNGPTLPTEGDTEPQEEAEATKQVKGKVKADDELFMALSQLAGEYANSNEEGNIGLIFGTITRFRGVGLTAEELVAEIKDQIA